MIVENKIGNMNEKFKEIFCQHVQGYFVHRLIFSFPGKLI